MNENDITKLKYIHIPSYATIQSYRYDAQIEYGGSVSFYHPNCISENHIYLFDYILVCKNIIDNIDTIKNVENQEHKFMVLPNLGSKIEPDFDAYYKRSHIKIYKTKDLTLDQAQEIIDNNIYWITQAQNAIHERVLINKINKIK